MTPELLQEVLEVTVEVGKLRARAAKLAAQLRADLHARPGALELAARLERFAQQGTSS